MAALALAAILALSAPPAAADAARGERVYERCLGCHALTYDRVGPRHCGLFGRRAGAMQGFEYSKAMRGSGIVWNAKTLDRFLADPPGKVPGTTMTYAGVADARDRADLIDYLARAGRSAECGRPR